MVNQSYGLKKSTKKREEAWESITTQRKFFSILRKIRYRDSTESGYNITPISTRKSSTNT